MYTIIKSMDDYVGGKSSADSNGVGIHRQTNPCAGFPGQRDILLDFTLKDNPPTLVPCSPSAVIKHQISDRHDLQKVIKKNIKPHLASESPLAAVIQQNKEKINSVLPQRCNQSNKDTSHQFSLPRAESNGDNINAEINSQLNYDREFTFEENLGREMSSTLIRKEFFKEFGNNSILDSNEKMGLSFGRSLMDYQSVLQMDREHFRSQDKWNNSHSHSKPYHDRLQDHDSIKNTSLSMMNNSHNLLKNSVAASSKQQEKNRSKTEPPPLALLNQQSREVKTALIEINDHERSKLISSLTLPPEQVQDENINYPISYPELAPQTSSSEQKFVGIPSNSYFVTHKLVQLKNTSMNLSNEHMKLNELLASDDNGLLNETITSYEDLSLPVNEGHHKTKNPSNSSSHSFPVPNEPVKNPLSVDFTVIHDLMKNNSHKDMHPNSVIPNIMMGDEKVSDSPCIPSAVQESNHAKSVLSSSPNNENSAAKLSCNFNIDIDQGGSNKNASSPYSVVHLQLPMKHFPPYLENALNGYIEENLNFRKHTSVDTLSRNIIQDATAVKEEQGSTGSNKSIIFSNKLKNSSCIPSTVQPKNIGTESEPTLFQENCKIKNYSFPIYEETFKQTPYQAKEIKESLLHHEENEVLDFRLKDLPLSCDSSLRNNFIDESINNSALKYFKAGHNILRSVADSYALNEPLRDKETLQSHPSVIAQVGLSCKVCSYCRNFYSENGFLNGDDSCTLCLYHAESNMKCVCTLSAMKDEICKCVEKKFRCSYCNEIFSTILQLQRHTFNHVAEQDRYKLTDRLENEHNFICAVCNAPFSSYSALEHHMNTHQESYCVTCNKSYKQFNVARHSCEARYICTLCGAGFASNYNLKIHLLKHSGSLPYKCRECNKSFAKPSELSKHSLVHSGERPYSCNECNMTFTSSSYLRSHKITHSGRKPHSCQICNKSFTRPADVKRHLLIHSGVRPYTCEVCGLAFTDASNMRKHMSTHSKPQQGSDIKTYHCTHCGKMFARPSELKRHFFTHTNTRPYACHLCGLAFTDSSNLKKHIQTHERSAEHSCLQCDSAFKSFAELEMHVSMSHGAKRFDSASGHTCQTCGASFVQLVDLQDHVLSHGASPTYRCDICSKNFCEKIFLERHLLTHTESRPYVCNECSKSFKSLSHLRSHLLIHSGEKSHICLKCNKSFLKKSSLLRHEGVHAKEKMHLKYQFI